MEKITKEDEKKLLDDGWIKMWILFDVQSNDRGHAEKALHDHVEKMKKEKWLKVSKENYVETEEVDAPPALRARGIQKMYSKLYEAVVFVKGVEAAMNFVVNYAPSALEIIAPDEMKVKTSELQNALVTVADILHKFAQMGLGGVVISR